MMLLMLVVRKDHNDRVDLADNDNDDYAYVGAADATDSYFAQLNVCCSFNFVVFFVSSCGQT